MLLKLLLGSILLCYQVGDALRASKFKGDVQGAVDLAREVQTV